jgi:nuclear pore complex protein Nup133
MFSSPARPIKGTPRRTAVSRAPRTPSVFSEHESISIPPPSTARTNRLAHLRRDDSPAVGTSIAETIRTVREVEGYERISWSRDERRAVNSLGALPKEVNALVKSLGKLSRSGRESS